MWAVVGDYRRCWASDISCTLYSRPFRQFACASGLIVPVLKIAAVAPSGLLVAESRQGMERPTPYLMCWSLVFTDCFLETTTKKFTVTDSTYTRFRGRQGTYLATVFPSSEVTCRFHLHHRAGSRPCALLPTRLGPLNLQAVLAKGIVICRFPPLSLTVARVHPYNRLCIFLAASAILRPCRPIHTSIASGYMLAILELGIV